MAFARRRDKKGTDVNRSANVFHFALPVDIWAVFMTNWNQRHPDL